MKHYYDDPIIAAYMAKYQRMDFGNDIHSIFEFLCTTDPLVFQEGVKTKFYLSEKNLKEIEPQVGDVVQGVNEAYFEITEEAEIAWVKQCNLPIFVRNDKPFFMPKSEE